MFVLRYTHDMSTKLQAVMAKLIIGNNETCPVATEVTEAQKLNYLNKRLEAWVWLFNYSQNSDNQMAGSHILCGLWGKKGKKTVISYFMKSEIFPKG